MSTQIDNIVLETNTSIIEKISRVTNMFINFWNNDFAFIEDDESSYESFESFLKQTHHLP